MKKSAIAFFAAMLCFVASFGAGCANDGTSDLPLSGGSGQEQSRESETSGSDKPADESNETENSGSLGGESGGSEDSGADETAENTDSGEKNETPRVPIGNKT